MLGLVQWPQEMELGKRKSGRGSERELYKMEEHQDRNQVGFETFLFFPGASNASKIHRALSFSFNYYINKMKSLRTN